MSFKFKIILGVAILEIFLLGILALGGLQFLKKSYQQELDVLIDNTTRLFGALIKDPLLSMDLDSLDSAIKELVASPDVVYVKVKNQYGLIGEGGSPDLLKRKFFPDHSFELASDGVFDTVRSVKESGYTLGTIEIGFDIANLHTVLSQARDLFISIAIFGPLIVGIFSYGLGVYLTRSLKSLAEAAKRISNGEIGHQVTVTGNDELSEAADAFNKMSNALMDSKSETQDKIQETEQIVERLREGETRLTTILNSAVDGIVIVDECGVIDEVNHSGAEAFGYEVTELEGESFYLLIGASEEGAGDFIQRHIETGASGIIGKTLTLSGTRKDGTSVPIQLSMSEMLLNDRKLYVALIRDVSEQISLESKRYRSDSIKSAIVDSTLDALLTINSSGEVIEFSPQASAIFGYSQQEAMGARMVELIVPPALRDAHNKGMQRYLDTGEKRVSGQRIEITALRKSGEEFPVELTVTPIEVGDEKLFTAFVRDISVRKQSEQELMQAKVIAESASDAKSRFLAHMSHEIRSPLNAVMGSLELLLDGKLNREQNLYATTALTSGRSLLGVINDVLDFSKIETNQLKLEKRNFSVRELVADVITLVDQRASEKGLDIGSFVDPTIPNDLLGDSVRIRQVLLNFADNAVKFTQRGGVSIKVELKREASDGVELYFEVKDSGIGIPRNKLESIFEEFARVDESEAASVDGTGLGLAISKQLVELMNGEISLDSDEGAGACFGFTLTLEVIEEAKSESVPRFDTTVALISFSRIAAETLKKQLVSFGCRVYIFDQMSDLRQSAQELAADSWLVLNEQTSGQSEGIELLETYASHCKSVLLSSLSTISDKRPEHKYHHILARPLTCSVLVRLLQETTESPEKQFGKDSIGKKNGLNSIKILLAEDSPANTLVARAILERAGYTVVHAANGVEAVSTFEKSRPDLILMDLRMPEMDGIEATIQIRNRSGGSDLPIIGLSANSDQRDIDRCLAAGMNDFITKPFEPPKFISTVAAHLNTDNIVIS